MVLNELFVGTVIKITRYGHTRGYRIESVLKNCTCPDPLDSFNGIKKRIPTDSHYHIEMKQIYTKEHGMNIMAGCNWITFKNNYWQSIFERFEYEEVFKIISHPKNIQFELFK